ncbi:MAG TPA: ABC-type transport auxiliary lipoprotein family protein [Rhodanobacteraceae bacterium]|nr:ABC-type transport auxiliary lipoprotein family protein [Rhodanobacteraceae bacterium]
MSKRWLALCACVMFLTGCMHATKANFPRHYTLGTAAPSLDDEHHPANARGGILQISSITVPDWLDGTAMYYRLDYRGDNRLSAYANSDWIAPPATLLEPLLQRAVVAGGGWRAVIGPRNPATADASLQVRLDDFSQVFSQPGQSHVIIDATVTLIGNRDDVIAQKHFRIQVPASSADAQGGAKALGEAAGQFAARVQQWLQTATVAAPTR